MKDYDLEYFRKSFLSLRRMKNKISCIISKYGMKFDQEGMGRLSREMVWCFQFQIWISEIGDRKIIPNFNSMPIYRSEMNKIRKQDWSKRRPSAHFFFEIPVLLNMKEETIDKLNEWCFDTLQRKCFYNKKRTEAWIKKKKIEQDFAVEDEKKEVVKPPPIDYQTMRQNMTTRQPSSNWVAMSECPF